MASIQEIQRQLREAKAQNEVLKKENELLKNKIRGYEVSAGIGVLNRIENVMEKQALDNGNKDEDFFNLSTEDDLILDDPELDKQENEFTRESNNKRSKRHNQ